MLRRHACLFASLLLLSSAPTIAASEPGPSGKPAVDVVKTQTELKDAAMLEIQGYRLASRFYLAGSLGMTNAEITQLQKIRKTGNNLAAQQSAEIRAAWQALESTINESALNPQGKPSEALHKKISERLDALSEAVNGSISEIRKNAKRTPRGPADTLRELAVRFESLIFHHLSGIESAPGQQLLTQANARFDKIDSVYTQGETGKAVRDAGAKWPVLREALLKGKEKNPVFMISRFHDQIADDLDTALAEQPVY
ncbi:MAG TPA: hypothetical protein VFW42_10355 [Fluviicoccus sp.]|nr:hypothetical protein [Fluviicoccus sp.]